MKNEYKVGDMVIFCNEEIEWRVNYNYRKPVTSFEQFMAMFMVDTENVPAHIIRTKEIWHCRIIGFSIWHVPMGEFTIMLLPKEHMNTIICVRRNSKAIKKEFWRAKNYPSMDDALDKWNEYKDKEGYFYDTKSARLWNG